MSSLYDQAWHTGGPHEPLLPLLSQSTCPGSSPNSPQRWAGQGYHPQHLAGETEAGRSCESAVVGRISMEDLSRLYRAEFPRQDETRLVKGGDGGSRRASGTSRSPGSPAQAPGRHGEPLLPRRGWKGTLPPSFPLPSSSWPAPPLETLANGLHLSLISSLSHHLPLNNPPLEMRSARALRKVPMGMSRADELLVPREDLAGATGRPPGGPLTAAHLLPQVQALEQRNQLLETRWRFLQGQDSAAFDLGHLYEEYQGRLQERLRKVSQERGQLEANLLQMLERVEEFRIR